MELLRGAGRVASRIFEVVIRVFSGLGNSAVTPYDAELYKKKPPEYRP